MKKDLNIKIGIVGAGPAGLTAADALKSKGYTNITILEKEAQAGGKCRSFDYEGRYYELGAGVIVANNHTVQKLAKKFGIEVALIDFSRKVTFFDIKTGKAEKEPSFLEKLNFAKQLFLTYKSLARRYNKIAEVGLSEVNADLCIPFSEWSLAHKLDLVAKAFGPFFTGFGYGYFDEIPAAYVLKYYSWHTIRSFMKKAVYFFPTGIQSLWLTVAKNQHVLYNSVISKVERDRAVKVSTEAGDLHFDKLILACPLDESLKYLDATEEENKMFSKIVYCDYRTYACLIKNFPKQDGYVPGNFVSTRKGHPVLWYHRYPDSDLYTFYVLGDWKISDAAVLKNIEQVVKQLGGTLEEVLHHERWKYFPHVSSEVLKKGFFDQLEALQGSNNTYFTGELLNLSTVEYSAEHAANLVKKFF